MILLITGTGVVLCWSFWVCQEFILERNGMQETWQHYIWARNEINIINFFITRKTQKKENTVILQLNFPHESTVKSLKFNFPLRFCFSVPNKITFTITITLQLHFCRRRRRRARSRSWPRVCPGAWWRMQRSSPTWSRSIRLVSLSRIWFEIKLIRYLTVLVLFVSLFF